MPSDRINDALEMLGEHDVAQLANGDFPCIYDSGSVQPFDAQSYGPRLTFAGKRYDGDTATVYGAGIEARLSIGDTVTKITDYDGDTWGPFIIEALMPDGVGLVMAQIRTST